MDGAMEGMLSWQSATPMPNYAQRQKDSNWEKKQRMREYRVAARRERRNRKADEKKQRKLNATILRRMVRNPEKYTKNASRNQRLDFEIERRNIWHNAIRQAQQLALAHDPSGAMFNVGAVTKREDGAVVDAALMKTTHEYFWEMAENAMADPSILMRTSKRALSNAQRRKIVENVSLPPPTKPVIPEGYSVPEGEEKYLALWDLSDEEIRKRLERIKQQKYEARRALRQKQQAGKVERRAARDEKRKVYRDLKMTWRVIKAEQDKYKTRLKEVEEAELQKIASEVNAWERQRALEFCRTLGFTLENTEGVADVKLHLAGEARKIDPDDLVINEDGTEIRTKREAMAFRGNGRVDLSQSATQATAYIGGGGGTNEKANGHDASNAPGDYLQLDTHDASQPYEPIRLNHKIRRTIRRAVEHRHIEREKLVRARAIAHLAERGAPVPAVLQTPPHPQPLAARRQLVTGALETPKQERTRAKLELATYNKNAKVLRAQAKERAVFAGLRVYAEMTGRIPARDRKQQSAADWGPGWYVPPPEDPKDRVLPVDLKVL